MFTLRLALTQTPGLEFQPRPQIYTITIVLGHLPDLDVKILLLKTPHTLVTGHGEIKLILTRKFLLTSFIVPKGAMQAAGGSSHQPSYPAVNL